MAFRIIILMGMVVSSCGKSRHDGILGGTMSLQLITISLKEKEGFI
jgi:hypothetical protein